MALMENITCEKEVYKIQSKIEKWDFAKKRTQM